MMNNFDVAIVGGGMVGMSMAASLARVGIAVAVIEKTAMPDQLEAGFDGRVSAISYGSKIILDGFGAWADMAPYAQPINDIRVSDGDTPFFLHYDHHEIGDAPFGYIVENRYIRNALHNAAKNCASLRIFDRTTLESFERDNAGVTLTLSNQEKLRCRLLIGADGKQSPVRAMADVGATEWGYNQTAIVCTIAHEETHDGLAQERFLPAGPFAVLPMTGSRSSLVWVEPNDRVGLYLELSEEDFVQEITERVGDYLGAIRVEGKRFSYPLSLMHANSYIGDRVALIGDAAHGMHPIAGQGVNLGFRDVGVLSQLITDNFKLGLDIGSQDVLTHYQRWRKFDNVSMLAVTDGLNRLFGINALPIQLARGLGMWAVGKMPPLKRLLMRHAMGLVGDLPRVVADNK